MRTRDLPFTLVAGFGCPDRAFFCPTERREEMRSISWRGFHVMPMGSDFFKHSPPFHQIRVLYPDNVLLGEKNKPVIKIFILVEESVLRVMVFSLTSWHTALAPLRMLFTGKFRRFPLKGLPPLSEQEIMDEQQTLRSIQAANLSVKLARHICK